MGQMVGRALTGWWQARQMLDLSGYCGYSPESTTNGIDEQGSKEIKKRRSQKTNPRQQCAVTSAYTNAPLNSPMQENAKIKLV